jgi:peptidoglycan/LPS O-acetylase OafA/YrhL
MLLARKTRPRSAGSNLFAGSFESLLHRPPNQIPFLDALRSLAILLVINGHASEEFTHKYGVNLWSRMPLTVEGWSGVDLFFVLSGFLIGGQIWKELRRTSDISIRQFILRRGFRIWPLYYCTYLFVLIVWWQHAPAKQYGWASLVFLSNYTNHGIVLGGWSLSTEEQFYCIVPICVYLFARRKDPRIVRFFLWGLLAVEPLIRTATWIYQTGGFFVHDADAFSRSIYYCFHTHCDGLIMGLILSHLWVYRENTLVPDASRQRRKGLFLVAGAFTLMILLYLFQHEIFSFTGLALFFGSLVWFGLTSRTRSFNSKIFYWISRLSYGMYLNHAYLVTFCVAVVLPSIKIFRPNSVANQILGTLILIVLSALISVVTFCLIEHPFLNLRKKMLGSHPPA